MSETNLTAMAHQVVWLTFALGIVFGAVAQRTHFCTMGAVGDIVNIGSWDRMRQWLLAIAVAIIGTNLLATSGQIDLAQSLYTSPRLTWLSHIIGGALFGFGMVLASGCGGKTLVRIGAGNLKSLVVFIVLGVSALISLRGILALPRANWLEHFVILLPTTQDLPSLAATLGGNKTQLQLTLASLFAGLLTLFVLRSRQFRTLENMVAGISIGLIIVAGWYVSGHLGYVAEHPDTLAEAFIATNSGRMESFSFVAPFAYTLDLLMMWTDASKGVSFGIAAAMGVIVGSLFMALITRSFRWEGFGSIEDTANHLVGAILMGFGGVTALGCTIGQGISGVSTLAIGSILSLCAILSGTVAALKYQTWRMERTT